MLQQSMIVEPRRSIPVRYPDFDVVVAGGGIAGISAALAAARAGSRVLLLERLFALGGLATLGLVTIYLPLCDGVGHQLSFGIAEELLHLSIKHGWECDYPNTWIDGEKYHGKQRYEVRYNAQVFATAVENLLVQNKVTILYGTTLCQVIKEHKKITNLIVENKDGRFAIPIRSVVDATGDADVFHLAGEKTRLYAPGNMMASWFYETIDGQNRLRMIGTTEELLELTNSKTVAHRITGIDAEEISRQLILSRSRSLNVFLQNGKISSKHSFSTMATIPQLRMTRCIEGAYTLDDRQSHKHFDDSIGLIGDWRKRGPAYEIPLRTLHSEGINNCLAAGRIISVTDAMWDISRVIPACAVTGQAAGIAAALSDDISTLSIHDVQEKLIFERVKLHLSDVLMT